MNRDGGSIGLTGQHVDVYHANHQGKDVAFKRFSDSGAGDECVIVANLANQQYSDYEFGLPAAGKWHRRVSTDRKQWSDDFGGNASGDINAIEESYDGQSH